MIGLIRRLPVLPTVLVLLAVGVMIRLGVWQLDRKEEKEALLSRYEAARVNRSMYPFGKLPIDDSAAYRQIGVWCGKVYSEELKAGRNGQGEVGWAHVARCSVGGRWPDDPVTLSDYELQTADIVIGWSDDPQPVNWKGGRVLGIVAPGGELKYRIVADPPLAGLEANAKPDPRDIPNNHLSYAIQWFLFALIALVIYALALRKRWLAEEGAGG